MRLMFIILLLTAIAFSGCSGSPSNSNGNGNSNTNITAQNIKAPDPIKPAEPVDPSFKPCNPYFPLVPGSTAKYVVNYSSGIVGDLTVVVDVEDENGQKVFVQRSQLVDRSGGMQIIQKITRKLRCDGERVIILSEKTESNIAGQESSADFEYRENSLMMTDPKSLLIKGSAWTHAFRPTYHSPGNPPARSDEPTIIAYEVGSPQHVTTAIGTFNAIPIARRVADNITVDQYVAGLGLVKRQSKEGSSWELKEYSGLTPQD
jgi:PBP1b-binding outer membrane lipoprotein LpoB